ncbi:pyoverdine/dityrosine biosynthesis protein [Colletotrichum higginsianum]|uniref:Pyoverdine/dityrosine biosynthesis protein n=3 Tax=Colletotrichum destructivum species complex TaxID=2707350 RepID=H1V6Z1_COLHI|nr:Pyoverdine/dityrosine biosynthesis protein [Colletotrichum higginsianum IMI 349063]OBR02281.1 Pyoverdine/dityrosine biosynthesis protein [Colletotrichum higginsianum IMI 349063]TID06464.1 Spore wall maturation protein DIT1 [Colletotrichum higginsianum]CCF35993.1 pyoverdine/dityrosine biosynthesis protein [Colletotrichum higginsianum]
MAISAAAPAPVSSTGAKRQLPGAPVGRPVLQLRAPTYRRPSLGSELKSPLSAISPLNASVLRSPLSPLRQMRIEFSDLEIGSPIDPVELTSPDQVILSPASAAKSPFSAFKSPLRNVSIDAIVDDQPTITETLPTPPIEQSTEQVAHKILDVLQAFGRHIVPEGQENHEWLGRKMFHGRVEEYVKKGESVKMIIPAFPWKSINRTDKVTGVLPDLGEDLALARLNDLCVEIGKVYTHGAEVHIATDGLVFNDVVGISDDETWEYGATLMDMAAQKGYDGIKLLRVMDFLGLTKEDEPLTREKYMELVDESRKTLEAQFGDPDKDVRALMETDNDTLMTYRGFIRFLETDLRNSPVAAHATSGHKYRKVVKEVAMKMMMRAESFTKIILATCPDHVRLSIHPSSGAVKLSMPLLVEKHNPDGFPRTPWHSSIAVSLDGGYRSLHAKDVRDTHDLVMRGGRPWCFREKSELFDLGDDVEIEHLYPTGIEVRPREDRGEDVKLDEAAREKLVRLARLQPVRVVGFENAPEFVVEGQE